MQRAELVAIRFGLGMRPGECCITDPAAELRRQLAEFDARPEALSTLPRSEEIGSTVSGYMAKIRELQQRARAMAEGEEMTEEPVRELRRKYGQSFRRLYQQTVSARFHASVNSDTPFAERLVHFWANHFAVSVDKPQVIPLAGGLEMDAVRPNLTGSFADLVKAASLHPAMLMYLDQVQSIGPGSPLARLARRRRQLGLNENLAREILELHTLGADGGYGQADVTEFARALTGWSVNGLARGPLARMARLDGADGTTGFSDAIHEPGPRQVLGRTYPAGDREQSLAIISDLATHPSTARHIATKLARHFVGDAPPEPMVSQMAAAYQESGGQLMPLYEALVASPEVWEPRSLKFKQPWEWLVSTYRATALPLPQARQLVVAMDTLGQPIWRPGSPAGYGDLTRDWVGPDFVFKRVEVAEALSQRVGERIDARALAPEVLGSMLGEQTALAIARAESPTQGLSLLLVSPEFLQR